MIGFVFARSFDKTQDSIESLSMSLCTSYMFLGIIILMIVRHLSGLVSVPL